MRQPLSLISIEPGRITASGIFRRAPQGLRGRQDAADSPITGDPFQDRLRQGLYTELVEQAAIESPIEHAESERTVDQYAETELSGQWQHAPLGVTKPGL